MLGTAASWGGDARGTPAEEGTAFDGRPKEMATTTALQEPPPPCATTAAGGGPPNDAGGGGAGAPVGSSSDESSPPTSDATSTNSTAADAGYDRIKSNMSSVLSHPVGLPLLCFLHAGGNDQNYDDDDDDDDDYDDDDYDVSQTTEEHENDARPVGLRSFLQRPDVTSLGDADAALARFFSQDDGEEGGDGETGPQRFDGVLQESYDAFHQSARDWEACSRGPSGHVLTETIRRKIEEKLLTPEASESHPSPPTLQVGHPDQLKYHPVKKSGARTDILIHHRSNLDEDKSGIALLLEVGLGNHKPNEDELEWWKKVDQNAQYLGHFLESMNKDSEVQFSGPTLFAVLSINKEEKSLAAFHSALLGVFLCVPRTKRPGAPEEQSPGFRVALLRRDEFHTLQDASLGFGRTLRAATALAGLLRDVKGGSVFKNYQYLGPNCCRIGNKVLRTYDSRFRRTHRRPDLYGDASIAPGARIVCRILDRNANRNTKQDFKLWDDRDPVILLSNKRLWLWEFKGELLVIETDYHNGRHYAKSPKEFIPVVESLQNIHERGYVHGDIRCANIVFGKSLIDFDMGGRIEDSPTYPPGYVDKLVDGNRGGRGGARITRPDDWYALLNVIFLIHKVRPPKPLKQVEGELLDHFEYFSALEPDESTILNLAGTLKSFLTAVDDNSWPFLPERSFKRDFMNERGYSEGQQSAPRATSHPATGSPQK